MCKLYNLELEVKFAVVQTVIHMIYCIIVHSFWNMDFKINDQGFVFYPNQWLYNSGPTGQTLNRTIGL